MGLHERRHIFEDKRYVEEYRVEDVEGELGLDRNALIRMALLLGRCSFPLCYIYHMLAAYFHASRSQGSGCTAERQD